MNHLYRIFLLIAIFAFAAHSEYVYDANDFAIDVNQYNPGDAGSIPNDDRTGLPFSDPHTALGRPSIDTVGDGAAAPYNSTVPVVPVFPVWRSYEAVSIGWVGHLTLKFNQPVRDDENNPFGYDFIVFGNSFQKIGGEQDWLSGNPANVTSLFRDVTREPGVVSLSQDGIKWFTFTADANFVEGTIEKFDDPNFLGDATFSDSTYADDFAPTLGRVYDPCLSTWWGEPTNPTLPLDPNTTKNMFQGKTVAEICLIYGDSAGGTAFDVSRFNLPVDSNGRKWFIYVRIDNPRSYGATPEIDAVSDISACGDWKHPFPAGDINKDCRVNLQDFSILAGSWLECSWNCEN